MLNCQLCSKFLSLPDFVICWKTQRLSEMPYCRISYDVAVFLWIMSCHKNRMTTLVITLYVTSLTTSLSTMHFLLEILSTLRRYM